MQVKAASENEKIMKPSDVIDFWVHAGPRHWFAKSDRFDAQIREHFEALHHCAARRDLDDWAGEPHGALALLILLDQFPRNMYRGSAHAFEPKTQTIYGYSNSHIFFCGTTRWYRWESWRCTERAHAVRCIQAAGTAEKI